MAQDDSGKIIGVGRLQQNSDYQAQIRYMAILPAHQGRGIGRRLVKNLEQQARNWGCNEVVLNARATCVGFYLKQDYLVTGEADTLFGCIAHKQMRKRLN